MQSNGVIAYSKKETFSGSEIVRQKKSENAQKFMLYVFTYNLSRVIYMRFVHFTPVLIVS